MRVFIFLGAAFLIAYTAMNWFGGWLLPQMGIEGGAQQTLSGAVSIAVIALLYAVMFRRPN